MRWYLVVCGLVCGGMWWYVVVCGGMWWYVLKSVTLDIAKVVFKVQNPTVNSNPYWTLLHTYLDMINDMKI